MKKESAQAGQLPAKRLHRLVNDLTSEQYHGLAGTWSSSQFKDILDDEEMFIRKYIKKEIERKEVEAFDTGTYFHTGLLEPHKIKSEIAMFPGKVRYGKEWDKFRAANAGKAIINDKQKEEGDKMIKAVQSSPIAMSYLKGQPEVSLFNSLLILNGQIYAPHFGKVLTKTGWEDGGLTEKQAKKAHSVIVKVRADCLGEGFVSDLKSTSANARKDYEVRNSISKYKYDLSAALYLDMFALLAPVEEFIWIFASKTANNCGTWRASRENIMIGRAKYSRAMLKLADCALGNWEIVDRLMEASPLSFERDWLVDRDTDFL